MKAQKQTAPISLDLPRAMVKRASIAALALGVSRNTFISRALARELDVRTDTVHQTRQDKTPDRPVLVRLTPELKKRVKIAAVLGDETMRDLARRAIARAVHAAEKEHGFSTDIIVKAPQ